MCIRDRLQIARRAVERIAAVSGVHPDGHIVVAKLVGNIHRKDGLAGLKVQNDVLPHAAFQILHIAVNIAGCCGELHNRRVAQVIAAPDAFHLIAGIGFDGIDTFDAGCDHAVALRQPVRVIDVGVALDGRVTVGIGKTCAACAEPVAHDSADGARCV